MGRLIFELPGDHYAWRGSRRGVLAQGCRIRLHQGSRLKRGPNKGPSHSDCLPCLSNGDKRMPTQSDGTNNDGLTDVGFGPGVTANFEVRYLESLGNVANMQANANAL